MTTPATPPDGERGASIRPFAATDVPAAVALMRATSPESFSADECAEFERSLLEEDMTGFHVMEEAGAVIACGGVWIEPEEDFASIYWVIVRPDRQGVGLGRRMVDFLLREVRRHGDSIVVWLDTTEKVTRFYEKLGFRTAERVEHGYDDGKTRYDMELPIANYT